MHNPKLQQREAMLGKQTLNPSRNRTHKPLWTALGPASVRTLPSTPPSPWTGGWTLGADATERLWPPDLRRVLLEPTTKYCANGSCTAEKSSGGVCGGGGEYNDVEPRCLQTTHPPHDSLALAQARL